MIDVRVFLLNRLSKCECAEWAVDLGWHAPDCRNQIEREFVERVTALRESGVGVRQLRHATTPGSQTAAPRSTSDRKVGLAGQV